MEIKRETITTVVIDENRTLQTNDTVKFIANGICHFGTFKGVTSRGCLEFVARIDKTKVVFSVMPKSIKAIEVIEHGING